jgi:hypothetical protein
MRLTVVLAIAVGVLSCATDRSVTPAATPATPDGLDRVAFYGVHGAFAKPASTLAGYQRVRFEEGGLSYLGTPRYPRGRNVPALAGAHTVELSAEDEARLWRHFRDVFAQEFQARSSLALVDDAGSGTLTVRAYILDLVVYQAGQAHGAETRFARHSPVFTLVLDVRDSQTDEPLARIVDRRGTVARDGLSRRIGSGIDSAGVRRQMARWARALRTHLHRLRA